MSNTNTNANGNTTANNSSTTTTSVTFTRRNRGNSTDAAPSGSSNLAIPPLRRDFAGASNQSNTLEPFPSLSEIPTQEPPPPGIEPWVSTPTRVTGSTRPPSNSIHLIAPTTTTTVKHLRRRPIGIKRISSNDVRRAPIPTINVQGEASQTGRRRSQSAPQGPGVIVGEDGAPLQPFQTAASTLAPVTEGEEAHGNQVTDAQEDARPARSGSTRLRRASDAAKSMVSRFSGHSDDPVRHDEYEYDQDVVDLLDVIDPEVSTLNTLTNIQNSLFVPDLGRWLNRRPTYELSRAPSRAPSSKPLPATPAKGPQPPPKDLPRLDIPSDIDEESDRLRSVTSRASIASVVQEEHYAVLPHGVSLEGWTEEEKQLLDDHVRHMLHSKRSKFKRSMRAFGKYVRKPLGFFVTLYAVLITLFGLAWVLFLIGWIYVGDRQSYIINVVDNVLVALFAVMGDGLIPWRLVDTYHMIYIAHYSHLSWRLRKKKALPKLPNHNDLPEKQPDEVDVEAAKETGEFSVLTPEQQKKFTHHQEKFSRSHTYYKPHETYTHHAFPLRMLVAIVCLCDAHSCLQVALGTCTWAISYHHRPAALTTTILCCSITVNILAGVLIKIGDNKTRKKDVFLRMDRQELTSEAMKKVVKHKQEAVQVDKKMDKELHQEWEKKHSQSDNEDTARTEASSSNSKGSLVK